MKDFTEAGMLFIKSFRVLIGITVILGSASLASAQTINALSDSTPGLSQDLAQVGTGQFTLRIKGSGFSSNSVARLGTTSLTTTFVDSATLDAVVPASLVKSLGTLAVTVVDGSNTSNSVNLKVAARADANANAGVNIGDALVIARSVGLLVKPAVPATLGDVNLNDNINIGDALVVARFTGLLDPNLVTPVITSTSVTTSTTAGTDITITGTGFSATAANNVVVFSKGDGTFTSAVAGAVSTGTSDKTLTVTVPSGAASGPIFVKRKDLGLPGQPFVLSVSGSTVPLYISKLSKVTGLVAASTSIDITGSGFSTTAASNTVTFSAANNSTVTATPSGATATALTVTVPTGAVSGFVSVTVGSQTSNSKSIKVSGTSTPLRVNHTYYGDVAGEPILIEGTGFNLGTPSDNQVLFSDSSGSELAAAVVVASGQTELIVLVPTGAVTGTLKVKTGSGSSAVTSNSVTYTLSATTGGVQAAATTDTADVVITRTTAIGAYQAVVTFDPNVLFVDPLNVSGGTGAGFTGKPTSINVDNVGGTVTINHFQLGNSPTGTFTVARIGFSAVAAGTATIGIDRTNSLLTDTAGNDLSVVSGDITVSKSSITVSSNQIATINSLSPANVNKGAAGFTLTVNGQKFARGAVVKFGTTDLSTTHVNGRTLNATVPASLLETPGNKLITVFNPAPGGGTSAAFTFAVNNPVPSLTSISPTESTSGTTSFTLTVKGKNFVSGSSKVLVAGTEWTTTFVSDTELTAALPANTTLTGGVFPVKVRNATPGGGDSTSKNLIVKGGAGLSADILINSPSAAVGAYDVTVSFDPKIVTIKAGDVKGGTTPGFAGATSEPTVVNRVNITAGTVIINDFQLTATPSGTSLKVATITFSPVSKGTSAVSLTTNALTDVASKDIKDSAKISLSVTSVQVEGSSDPEILKLDPSSTAAGGSAEVQVTVEGQNLTKGLVATFDGKTIGTVFNSDSRMTVTIPASLLKVPGTYPVVLSEGTTETNKSPFEVTNPVEAPVITSITLSGQTTAASGKQGETIEADINGSNLTGASEVTFSGEGVTGTIGAGGSSTKVPVSVKIDSAANTGARSITLKATGGTTKSSTVTFKVNPAADKLALTIDPGTLQLEAGATSSAVTVSASAAVSVDTAVSIETSNAQIAISPASVTISKGQSSTTFQVKAAGPGEATLTLKAGGFSSSALTVIVKAKDTTDPIIESIDPTTRANTAGTFTITIKGAKLKRANKVEFFGAGTDGLVKDDNLTVAGSSITEFDEDNNGDVEKITAVATVASGAKPGPRVVVVTTADLTQTLGTVTKTLAKGGSSTKKPSSANILTFTGTDTRPAISSGTVKPNTVVPGQTVDITITGTNLLAATGSTLVRVFTFDHATQQPIVDPNLPVTVTTTSSTAIVGKLVVNPAAEAGPRAVIVKTDDGVSDFVLTSANRLEVTGVADRIPTITSVAPGSGNPNTTGTALTIKGGSLTGATSVVFLDGTTPDTKFTTDALTISPAGDVITTKVNIAAGATPGSRTVVVLTPTGTSSAAPSSANTFAVSGTGTVPAISSISPATGGPGQTISNFTITGTNLGSSPTVRFLRPTLGGPVDVTGTEVTVTNVTPTGGTQATMTIAITANAQPGPLIVTYTSGALTSANLPRTENTFSVTIGGAGQPTITGVSSKEISIGGTVSNFTVTGTSLDGGTLTFLKLQLGGPVVDNKITVTKNTTSSSATQFVGSVAVDPTADPAPRVALITLANGSTTGSQPTAANVVQIVTGATGTPPRIDDLSPRIAFPGQATFTLTLRGGGYTGATEVRFLVPSFGGPVVNRNITTGAITVNGDGTQITVPVTVPATSVGGPNIVQVIAGSLRSSDFPGPNVLFIDTNGNASEPRIDRSEPGDAAPGQKFQLKLFGLNFANANIAVVRFLQLVAGGPSTDSSFTVGTPTVSGDGTSITVNVEVAATAAVGPRLIQVANSGDTVKSVNFPQGGNNFFVRPGAITGPQINFVQPPFLDAGAANVPFVINGSNLTGATASSIQFKAISSAGSVSSTAATTFTVGSVITVDPIGSRIAGTISVGSGTAAGNYLVQVTIGSQSSSATSTGGNVLRIGKSGGLLLPTITSVTPSSFAPGASVTVSIAGTNFTGATKLLALLLTPQGPFEDGDIKIENFSVSSAAAATAKFSIGTDAGPGLRVLQIFGADANSPDGPAGGNVIDVIPVFAGFGGGIQNLPNISAISPAQGNIGQTISNFSVTGTNLTGTNAILFFAPGPVGAPEPDPNFVVSGINAGATTATASVTINPGAREVPHLVVVQTATGPSPIFPDPARIFSVTRTATTGSVPVITSVSPGGSAINTTASVTINGSNFTGLNKISLLVPRPGGPQVDRGVTIVDDVGSATDLSDNVNSDGTQIKIKFNIGTTAIPGPHSVVVSTSTGPSPDGFNPANVFAVGSFAFGATGTAFNPPDITSVTPGTITAGLSDVTVTIKGTNFPTQGGVVAFLTLGQFGPIPDPNISIVGTPTFSTTEILVKISLAGGAASGPRAIVIRGPAGGSANVPTPFNTILVTGGSTSGGTLPEIRNVSPNSDAGATGTPKTVSVTLNGANLSTVTSAAFLIPTPAGPQLDTELTVTGLTASPTGTDVKFTVTIPASATNGPRFAVVKGSAGRSLDFPTPDNTFFVTLGGGGIGTGGFGLATPPRVTSVSSATSPINPGAQGVVVTIVGQNIQNATDVILFAPAPGGPIPDINVRLKSFTVSGTAASATVTATIDVTSIAQQGDRTVVVMTPFGPTQNAFESANTLRIGTSTGGPVDFNNLPFIDIVSPQSALQGQTITGFKATGRNLTGASGIVFVMPTPQGPVEDPSMSATGISVNPTGTEVTATVTVGASAVTAPRFVLVRTPNGDAGNPPSPNSTINIGVIQSFGGGPTGAGQPTITSITPASHAADGATFSFTVTGTSLTGAFTMRFFQPTPQGPIPNPSILVTNFTVATGGTSATGTVKILSTTASGPQFVVIPTPSGPAGLPPTKGNTFDVTGGVSITAGGTSPLVFSVAPQTVPAGSIVNPLVLSGQNLTGANKIEFFEFDPNSTTGVAATADSSITVTPGSIAVGAEGKSVSAAISITGTGKAGPRIVVVTTAGGDTPKVPAGNVLNVVANAAGPTIEAISPNSGTPGQPLTLTINGRFLCTDASCTTSPEILFLQASGTGPVVDTTFSVTITTKTQSSLTAIVNVPATLTDPQFRIVAVRNAAGRSSDAPSPGNLLNFGTRTNAPTITDITTTPVSLTPGDARTIALTGTNLQGVAVNFFIPNSSGAPQKDQTLFAKVTASTSTSVTASVNIPLNAGGSRLVIVNGPNGDNFGQETPKFITITNTSAPTITSVSPAAKPAGGAKFPFTVTGTNLASVTGMQFIIPGLTPIQDGNMSAPSITKTSTSVAGDVTIASSAPPGPRFVLLFVGTTPVFSEPKPETTFFVVGGTTDATAPFLFSASPTFLIAGLSSQSVTLNGNNLGGAQVKLYNLPSGTSDATQDTSISATVDPTQSSSSSLTANVVVPTSASGARIVVVETLSGNNLKQQPPIVVNIGSLPTGGTAPHIDSLSPTSGNPGSSVNITVTGTNFTGLDSLFVLTPTPSGPQFDPNFTVSSVTATSTQITATLAISSTAQQGGRFIVVGKAGDSTKRSEPFPNPGNTFFVGTPGGTGGGNLPAITSTVPGSHAADNVAFQLFVGGSNLSTMNEIKFLDRATGGASTAFTVTSPSFDSGKNGLTATVQIAASAPAGEYVVIARNNSTGLSTPINANPDFSNVFRVGTGTASAATITSISPTLHAPDGVAFTFTITGTNLNQAAKAQLVTMGANPQPNFTIQLSGVTIATDGTSITGQMTIPATSPTGLHHVVLLKADNTPAGFQPPEQGKNILNIGAATGTLDPLIKTNGDGQTGPAGQVLAIPLEVVVTSGGNPAAGVGVSFAPTSGGGFVSPGFVQTDSAGKARSFATLGQTATGTAQTFSASAGGQTVTFTATVGTASTGPIPTEMVPNSAIIGAQNIQMTIRGSNFNSVIGVSMRFSGQPDNTITFTNFNNNLAGQVTVTMNISSSATAGDRVLVLEISGGSIQSNALFKVNAATGTFVQEIVPNNGTVGQSNISFTVRGNNLSSVTGFKFIANAKNDTAITVSGVNATVSGQVTATLNIGAAALVGLHNLVLVAGTTDIPTDKGFQVNAAGSPSITSLTPGSGNPGQSNVAFTINGSNLTGVTAVKFKFGGVTVTDGSLTTGAVTASASSITTTLSILSTAKSGQYSIVLVPSSGVDFDTAFPFSVQGTGITGVTPNSGTAGGSPVSLTITGNNLSGVTGLKFSFENANDAAITASSVVAQATQVTATVTIGSNAKIGGHNIVLVVGPSDVLTGAIFQVNAAAGGPTVTGLTPDNGSVGQQNITLTITGSGFSSVTGIKFNSSPGVQDTKLTVSNFTKNTDNTQITATLNIATDAPTGGRGLVLVTSSGDVGSGRSFQVNAGGTTTVNLNVQKSGTGTGSVTSSPAGINCGTACFFGFSSNASVTLTAAADTGSTFGGWTGSGCTGTSACTVTMDAAKSVTATFNTSGGGGGSQFALTVQKSGSGTVISNPTGIDCGTTCTANFNSGTSVTLTATPATGSTFGGWTGGGCTGSSPCTVTMDAAKSVTATFNP